MAIDEDHYKRLADWAESPDREIHPERGETGRAAAAAGRELLRRVAGRPSLDPGEAAGGHSPRRQVRLPRDLSDRLDALAEREGRSASDLMREAIGEYVTSRRVTV